MNSFAISGLGAVTPVGLSAPATAAALRAGIARLGPIASSETEGEHGAAAPATGGRVPLEWFRGGPEIETWPGHERVGLEPPPPIDWEIPDGVGRLVALAVPAVAEAWVTTGRPGRPPDSWGLFLGLADGEPGLDLAAAIRNTLAPWQPRAVQSFSRGRAAFLEALHRAVAELASGRLEGALVGGVDSLIRPSVYERLADAGVLNAPDETPQGILPGEGAAFLVLESRALAGRTLARVQGTGLSDEPTTGTDRPNEAAGLSLALRTAVQATPNLPHRPLSICDLNGDRYRALEWGLASIRALGDLKWLEGVSDEFWHPADCLGDAGAASGAINCVWAVESLRKDYAGSDAVLVWGASDGPLRGAAVLRAAK